MRFKICAFNNPAYASSINELKSELTSRYLNTSVSVKYVNESGLVCVLFVDVLHNGECRGSYSDLPIDFKELDILAAVSFEIEPALLVD